MDPRRPQEPPPQQQQQPPPRPPSDMLKDAAIAAAASVAEAENKEYLALDAAKEVEEIEKLIDEAKAMLDLAIEIYEKCSRGEVVNLADE